MGFNSGFKGLSVKI